MVLVTVLLLVGIAAAVLAMLLSSEEVAIDRATRMAQAAQAAAIARGGEASAIVALRRDMAVSPDVDDAAEPWARIAERDAPIVGGRFALAIADATGKIDLNPIARGDPVARARLVMIAAALRLGPGAAERIAALLTAEGPLVDLTQLGAAGLDPAALARLAEVATLLPAPQPINLNAAPEPVLALLLDDPAAAHQLAARRARTGRLDRDDFSAAHAGMPAGCSFTSQLYWVRARATIGDTSQQLTSLLERSRDAAGSPRVLAIARWRGPAPLDAPPLG